MKISDIMTKKVISVDEDTEIAKALTLMETNHIKELPVTLNGKFSGIVTLNSIVTYPDYNSRLKVKNLMSMPATLSINDDLFVAVRLMKDVGIPGLPVINSDNELVGFVSDYDVIKALKDEFKDMNVNDVMHQKPPILKSNDSIIKAKRAMYYSRIEALPIVDINNKMIGLLREDNMGFLLKPREKMAKSQLDGDPLKMLNSHVKDFMSEDFFVISIGEKLPKTIDLMLKNHVTSAIITDDELEPVGYVQRSDFISYLCNKLIPRGVMLNFSGFKLDYETDIILTKVVSDHLNTFNYLAKNIKSIDCHIKSVHAGEGARKFELNVKVLLTSGVMKNITKVSYALRECMDEALTDLEKMIKKDFGKK